MIKVIAFDLDGTLFDHEESANAAIKLLAQEKSWEEVPTLETTWQQLEKFYFKKFANREITFEEQRRKRMMDFVSYLDVEIEDSPEKYFQDYLGYYKDSWKSFPEVEGVLRELNEMGLPLAILTNGESTQQNFKLSKLGITQFFKLILASDELLEFKPHPSSFLSISAFFGVNPHEVMYVGDDLEIDFMGATSAGLRATWINRKIDHNVSNKFESLPSLSEVPPIIRELNH